MAISLTTPCRKNVQQSIDADSTREIHIQLNRNLLVATDHLWQTSTQRPCIEQMIAKTRIAPCNNRPDRRVSTHVAEPLQQRIGQAAGLPDDTCGDFKWLSFTVPSHTKKPKLESLGLKIFVKKKIFPGKDKKTGKSYPGVNGCAVIPLYLFKKDEDDEDVVEITEFKKEEEIV